MLSHESAAGLFGRGLGTRYLTNGIQARPPRLCANHGMVWCLQSELWMPPPGAKTAWRLSRAPPLPAPPAPKDPMRANHGMVSSRRFLRRRPQKPGNHAMI